jgi:hypothetical protein
VVGAVGLVVLCTVGVPTLVGMALDREHVARSAIDLSVDCVDAFALVEEPDGAWNSAADDVAVTIEENRGPQWLRTRIEPNPVFGGSWTWTLTPGDTGCTVTLLEQGWVGPWPIRAVVAVLGHHGTMDQALRDLSVALDAPGEPRHLD